MTQGIEMDYQPAFNLALGAAAFCGILAVMGSWQ